MPDRFDRGTDNGTGQPASGDHHGADDVAADAERKRFRDAELDLDKEVSDKFIESLSRSLLKRKKGRPMRLLYDTEMPMDMLAYLVAKMGVNSESLIPGNRYHNFKDFIAFPNVGRAELEYPKYDFLPVDGLSFGKSLIALIAKKDYLVSTPYQSFDYIIHFLREAAIDPKVKEIIVITHTKCGMLYLMNKSVVFSVEIREIKIRSESR